jgi:hypothetical protein
MTDAGQRVVDAESLPAESVVILPTRMSRYSSHTW